jgi:hypothetical protein
MEPKLLSRDAFREAVFKRDGYRCVFCGKRAEETPEGKLDAHHIIERRLWSDGGYYIDNGATVCEEHHLECEKTIISVEEVRERAGITKIIVPDQFYPEQSITKWGDYILENGLRSRGELFFDESVQKVLERAGMLDRYVWYTKYCRTFHLPWSPGAHDDDKTLTSIRHFNDRRVIVTRKMDGENTTAYWDGHVHARSIDSKGGEDRAWVKQFLVNNVCFNLPEGWRVCGENMWNEKNECLPWDETLEWFELLGITPVPVLYTGAWDEKIARDIAASINTETCEGFVVRITDGFKYSEFKKSIAKWVRANHVQTVRHWRQGARFKPNGLRDAEASSKG